MPNIATTNNLTAMNRKILTFLLFISCTPLLQAQSFQKGQKDINIGLSVGSRYYGHGYSRSIPNFNVGFDYGITDAISLGGYMGFSSATYEYTMWRNCGGGNYAYYNDEYRWRFFILGVRGAYHFDKLIQVENLDVYAGLFLGNSFATYSYTTNDPCKPKGTIGTNTYGGPVFDGFLGARYRFNDKFGVFCEVGYYLGFVNLGLNIKL
jgi:hypothetical protein